jgi:hypothetical protein
MKINSGILRNTLFFFLVLGLFAILNLLLHEFGHCVTIEAVRGECEGIYVFPGVKIWPWEERGNPYKGLWDNKIALTQYEKLAPTEKANGLNSLMGSGSVAVASLLALAGLYVFHPKGWVRFPLLAQSMMFLDLLLYTILPRWFGRPHFFFIGGDSPEPLEGAIQMGIPETFFIACVLLYSALMITGLIRYIWRGMKSQTK